MEADGEHLLLESLDYFIQLVLGLLGFVHPWLAPRGARMRAFGYPLMVSFFWGIWRMAVFDPSTGNDVPGIGYLLVGCMLGIVALFFSIVRSLRGELAAPTKDDRGSAPSRDTN